MQQQSIILAQMNALLDHVKKFATPTNQEVNLFSIGARGHFENPVSDVLAFFLDPNGAHELGSLALEALLACLPTRFQLAPTLTSAPEREVSTEQGNRIDLLLEAEQWIMIIENKIWHQQINPFDDYVAHLQGKKLQDKTPYFIVLSPEGRAPKGWVGISYPALTVQLSARINEALINAPHHKWLILLREYVLHLESFMKTPAFPAETEEFIRNNLHRINELMQLKNAVISGIMEEGKRLVNAHFSHKLNYEVRVGQHTWYGYPALRFSLSHWISDSDVVLYLNGHPGEKYDVRIYVCRLTNEQLRSKAVSTFAVDDSGQKYWDEKKGTVIGFPVYFPQTTEKAILLAEVVRSMELLDLFECEQR